MKKYKKPDHPPCTQCGAKNVVKNGKSNGKQRFWCRHCGATFHVGSPRYTIDVTKQKALAMTHAGESTRTISNQLGVNHMTVWKWKQNEGAQLAMRLRGIAWNMEQGNIAPNIVSLEKLPVFLKKNKSTSSYALLVLDDEVAWLRL